MKKAIAILLTALLMLTVFVSCEGDVEDMFGKTVSFNGNGSTSGQMAQMKVKKGEEVTLPANEFTRTDYVFAGWNTQADGSGTGYADKAKASFDDNTVLYAQWAEELTITFNANDGSETPETTTQEVEKDVETALAANSFTSPDVNYVFAGWTTDKAGEKTYYGDKESVTLTENITLYAQWGIALNNLVDKYNWEDGKTYTITDNLTLEDNRVTANGTSKLFLASGKTLTVSKGITVTGTNSLTINGKGSLSAGGSSTPEYAAGIGGGDYQAGGIITINGGTVTATGGLDAAGIGGGWEGTGGTISITGGSVTATGYDAAGIGGGYYGAGGTISISGGDVKATGGPNGAGIGGGLSGNGGTISITGGSVTATGGSADEPYVGSGAGIGGGYEGAGGTVAINGGTVTATGGSGVEGGDDGSGIGAGGGSSSHGTLTIGENPTTPYTDGKLRIASGWALYYGQSSASESIGEGTYDSWSDYAKKCMNVTQPST